jgi:hypothetical protein
MESINALKKIIESIKTERVANIIAKFQIKTVQKFLDEIYISFGNKLKVKIINTSLKLYQRNNRLKHFAHQNQHNLMLSKITKSCLILMKLKSHQIPKN